MFYIKCKKIYKLETRQDYLQCIGYFLFLTDESWLTLEPQIVSYYCFKSLFYLFSQQWKPLFKWLLNLRGFSWIRQGLTGNKNFFFFFFYLVGYRFFPLLGRPTKVFSKWQIYINWVRVAEVWLKWRNSKHFSSNPLCLDSLHSRIKTDDWREQSVVHGAEESLPSTAGKFSLVHRVTFIHSQQKCL